PAERAAETNPKLRRVTVEGVEPCPEAEKDCQQNGNRLVLRSRARLHKIVRWGSAGHAHAGGALDRRSTAAAVHLVGCQRVGDRLWRWWWRCYRHRRRAAAERGATTRTKGGCAC